MGNLLDITRPADAVVPGRVAVRRLDVREAGA